VCACVCLCVRRRFHVLIDATESARTIGFRDREPARTVGFQKREPVRTENRWLDRVGRGRGQGSEQGRAGDSRKRGSGERAARQGRAGRAGGQGARHCGQGRGTHGGLHSGLRPWAPTSSDQINSFHGGAFASVTRGVCGLAIYIKKYLKAKRRRRIAEIQIFHHAKIYLIFKNKIL
jgi:hypothetical protein